MEESCLQGLEAPRSKCPEVFQRSYVNTDSTQAQSPRLGAIVPGDPPDSQPCPYTKRKSEAQRAVR